jgi:hypothetical protein
MDKPKKTFSDHIKDYLTPSLLIGAIIAGALFWGRFETHIKEVTFDDSSQKFIVVKAVEEGPTAEQKHRDRILDSLNNIHAIKSRKKRDSILMKMSNKLSKLDTLYLKTSDQVYQIKEELKNPPN